MVEYEPHIIYFDNSPGHDVIEKQMHEFWDETTGPCVDCLCTGADHVSTFRKDDGTELTRVQSRILLYTDISLNLAFFIEFFDRYKYRYQDIDFCDHAPLFNS